MRMQDTLALGQPKNRLQVKNKFPAFANAAPGAKCQHKKTEAALTWRASYAAAAGAGLAQNRVVEVKKTTQSC